MSTNVPQLLDPLGSSDVKVLAAAQFHSKDGTVGRGRSFLVQS